MQPAFGDLPQRVPVGNKRVRIQQKLGNGAFGVVYKVIDDASSDVYALKDVPCLIDSPKNFSNAVREVTTLSKISHENVITIMEWDWFRDSPRSLHMLLLTEYCAGGNLNERLAFARPSSIFDNLEWMSQIAAALAHLHSRGVVHRDLKADNVLLTAAEDVKLADFGLAREFIAFKRTDSRQNYGSWMTSYTQYYMNSGTGPIHWVAPEFFTGHYTEKADVFSLGALFYAILERDFIMIDGKKYYGAFKSIRGDKVGLGYAMATVDAISIAFSNQARGYQSNALQSVVLEALKYNKDDRPSAQEVYAEIENSCNFITRAMRVMRREACSIS